MTKYLVTPTLLNSFSYYVKDEWKTPKESRADFLKTLSREKFEPNEAMQRGIDFENAIQEYCKFLSIFKYNMPKIPEFTWHFVISELAGILEGGIWQQSYNKTISIGNNDFVIYCRSDVVKADTVYDIKYTSKYDIGKFQDSAQHLFYLFCSELPKASYLISNGKDWWFEDYFNYSSVEDDIKSKISEFLSYLENDKEARDMFYSKWESKY